MKKKHVNGVWHRHTLLKISRIMKLTLGLLLLLIVQGWAINSYSQKVVVNLDLKNVDIIKVLDEIEKQTDYYFLFNYEQIRSERKIDVKLSNSKIDEVLNKILEGTGLNYSIKNRQIVISKDTSGRLNEQFSSSFSQQQKTISGKVTDSSGAPLPGVSVVVKGTTTGVITDMDGKYTLSKIPENATLQFSFVGMKTMETPVVGNMNINVTLVEETIGIEEVVAVGYGTMKKSDLTGSISSVRNKDIIKVPAFSAAQVLQGRASGVLVSNYQSQPGGDVSVRIRGINSIQGDNDPLVIVDGVIGGSIATINPTDIESIDILKDASSTAIYGSRGANGVIIVTTKTGKVDKNTVSVDAYYGVETINKKLDIMNAQEYAGFVNAIDNFQGKTLTFSNLNNLTNTDWQNELYQLGVMQDYKFSSTGGTGKLNYYMSGGYTQHDGVVIGTKENRYNLRLNLDSKISDALNVGSRFGISWLKTTPFSGGESNYTSTLLAIALPPTTGAYDSEGNLVSKVIDGDNTECQNPVYYQKNMINHKLQNIATGNIFAELKILKDLKFKSSFGFQVNSSKDNSYKASTVYTKSDANKSIASVSTSNSWNWLSENYFTYNKQFENQNLQVIGGFTAQRNYSESLNLKGEGFAIDSYEYHNLSAATSITSKGSSMSEWSKASFYGRIHYSLKDKYLFTFNSRYDGFSAFGENNKWAFFPSAAFGWRMSEEPFLKGNTVISNLKLRCSYGISGSEGVSAYSTLAKMKSSYFIDKNEAAIVAVIPSSKGNPDLHWEQTGQFDLGLDLTIGSRYNFIVDYFEKKTTDLFLDKPVPYTTGFTSVLQNIGSLKNYGVEIGFDTRLTRSALKWDIAFNLCGLGSKVLDLGVEPDEDGIREIITGNVSGDIKLGYMQTIRVGEPLGMFYGYKTKGIWQVNEVANAYTQFGKSVTAGDVKFVDQNGDMNIDDGDRVLLGRSQPQFYGGLNNTFSWKNWDLSVFFNFVIGANVLNVNNNDIYNDLIGKGNRMRKALNYWTENNTNTNVPRIGYSQTGVVTDLLIEDASFLRMREMTLGYSLPIRKLGKMSVQKVRFYIQTTNLFTLTSYTGSDPEVSIYGGSTTKLATDNGSYPRSKSLILGLNLTF